jgi:hypothetical protein
MWLASRRLLKFSARELLAGETTPVQTHAAKRGTVPFSIAILCVAAAIVLTVISKNAEMFFVAGALLLIGGLLSAAALLRRIGAGAQTITSLTALGASNASRRRGRSLATIAVLASGVFMIVAVDSFRHEPMQDWQRRDSGTGGFALIGESATPIYEDLNSPEGREAYGLDDRTMADVHVVPIRVREGDDASCLNLNRALQPRLLGVKPAELARLGAFADVCQSAHTRDRRREYVAVVSPKENRRPHRIPR